MPFDPVEQFDFEIQKYVKMPLPQFASYDPPETEKEHRPGCEFESVLRQRRGEPQLEKVQ